MDKIIKFINKRFQQDCCWLDGNCYWFAQILSKRFPELKIYYDPIDGHFLAGNGQDFYDWLGKHSKPEQVYEFNQIKQDDPLWYSRLKKECIE